jgi:hypothetical protein
MPKYTVCVRYPICPAERTSFWQSVLDAERLWHPRNDLSHPGIGAHERISALTFQSTVDAADDRVTAERSVTQAAAQTCAALRETCGHVTEIDHPVIHVFAWHG